MRPIIYGFSAKIILLLLLLCCVEEAAGFLDYTEEHLLNCKKMNSNEVLQETLIIHEIDRWIFLCLSPIAILSTLFIIITFIKYPTTRRKPGDIILAISLSDFVLCIHWIISSWYSLENGIGPDPEGVFCQVNSFFSTAAGTSEFVYNCCFCLYMILVIRNNLEGQKISQSTLHLICCSVTFLVVITLFSTRTAGLSLFGTCSFSVNEGFPVFGVLVLFAYLLTSWYTIWYFRKSVPNNQIFKKMREEFLRYYFYYVVSTSMIWSILSLSYLIAGFNCSYFQIASLNIIITIGNAAKIGTPIVLSIIRYKDPTIRKKVHDQLSRLGITRSSRPSLTNPLYATSTTSSVSSSARSISLSDQMFLQK